MWKEGGDHEVGGRSRRLFIKVGGRLRAHSSREGQFTKEGEFIEGIPFSVH